MPSKFAGLYIIFRPLVCAEQQLPVIFIILYTNSRIAEVNEFPHHSSRWWELKISRSHLESEFGFPPTGDPTPRPPVPQPPGPGLPPRPNEPKLPPPDPEPELPGFPEPADVRLRLTSLNQVGFGLSIRRLARVNWFSNSRIVAAEASLRRSNGQDLILRNAAHIVSPGILHQTLLTFNYLVSF